ncbi:unnamed protein product [Brassica napus]|uniref:(rape) hypothetical protein n=1 Tax=Brassica napus TaxID=3708 RepID=A0A816TLH8_BRANA|nr:unnamed protein product [Brassica napus]
MFEGYILSLKGHFNSEVGGLRTDLQAATTAIAHLETTVTGEFDKINQLLKSGPRGADMGATYGFSPARHSSPFRGQNDDFNYTEVNPDRHTTHSGVPQSTPRDGEDVAATETASGGLGQNLDEGEMGEGLSPEKQTESTHGAELRAQTGVHHGGDAGIGNVEVGEQGGDADIGHDPINVENPSPSVNVAAPDNSDAANPPSRVDVDEVNVSSNAALMTQLSASLIKLYQKRALIKTRSDPPLVLELMYLRHHQMSIRRKWVLMVCMTLVVTLLLRIRVRMRMKMMLQLLKFRLEIRTLMQPVVKLMVADVLVDVRI